MRRNLIAGIAFALVLAACSPATVPTTTSPASPATTTTTTVPVTTTKGPAGTCPGEGAFKEGGRVARVPQPNSDATTLGRISWDTSKGCEIFTFTFETAQGAPATTPPSVRAAHLETFQILRIYLDIEATTITDQLVETPLVDRLFVVRSLDGGMFVDLHLASPAQARVKLAKSPASLTLFLQPGENPFDGAATAGDLVVVASPPSGAEVDQQVTVIGYSRTFEANVLFIATAGDEIVAETFTTAADWVETWGEFRTSLQLPPGEISLFVGEESPRDGTLEGVTISLTVR
ncbi:MAG: Gmad2 immunoglobulin-like domain-containing protein [Acidimicrobiia bacterium]